MLWERKREEGCSGGCCGGHVNGCKAGGKLIFLLTSNLKE